MFDLPRIAASRLVAQIDYHQSLGSTSDRALELATRGDAALPLLVLAERQTAGRGRGTNRWLTSDGALTFSLVLHAPPDSLPPDRWPQVALVAGLAVSEALHSLVPAAELQVKWPNDVYLSGRKVCGILSESVPGWRDRLVVGIGVNVNNSFKGNGHEREQTTPDSRPPTPDTAPLTPHNLHHAAIALIDHDGLTRDLTNVLLAVLDQFDLRWRELLEGEFRPLAARYRERCLLTNRAVTIQQAGDRALVGLARGIDDTGALRIHNGTAEIRVLSGTVAQWE